MAGCLPITRPSPAAPTPGGAARRHGLRRMPLSTASRPQKTCRWRAISANLSPLCHSPSRTRQPFLPLLRSRFLQTVPLIIGSLVPGRTVYFPARLTNRIFLDTHTLYGSVFICLPAGAGPADTDPALAGATDRIARCPCTVDMFAIHRALQCAAAALAHSVVVDSDRLVDAHCLGFVHASNRLDDRARCGAQRPYLRVRLGHRQPATYCST